MLGEPLLRGPCCAHFLRAGGVTIGSALIFFLFGCATTAGSASYETSRVEYDRSVSRASRSGRDDDAIGLKAPVLERRAYVRGPGLQPIRDLLMVSIDLSDFRFR